MTTKIILVWSDNKVEEIEWSLPLTPYITYPARVGDRKVQASADWQKQPSQWTSATFQHIPDTNRYKLVNKQ
jgi:hypothetical protein